MCLQDHYLGFAHLQSCFISGISFRKIRTILVILIGYFDVFLDIYFDIFYNYFFYFLYPLYIANIGQTILTFFLWKLVNGVSVQDAWILYNYKEKIGDVLRGFFFFFWFFVKPTIKNQLWMSCRCPAIMDMFLSP